MWRCSARVRDLGSADPADAVCSRRALHYGDYLYETTAQCSNVRIQRDWPWFPSSRASFGV